MPAVIEVPVESDLATASVNVWHWIVPNSALVTESNNAIAALDTFYTAIASSLSAQTFTIGRRVRTVDQNPNLLVGSTPQTSLASGGAPAVLTAAALLSLGSSIIGGSRNGRKYLGPLTSTAVATGGRTLTAGTISAISAAAATLMATTTGGIQLAVWSRTLLVATPVTSNTVRAVLGTQRRRMI